MWRFHVWQCHGEMWLQLSSDLGCLSCVMSRAEVRRLRCCIMEILDVLWQSNLVDWSVLKCDVVIESLSVVICGEIVALNCLPLI